jgi:hypothetical protein
MIRPVFSRKNTKKTSNSPRDSSAIQKIHERFKTSKRVAVVDLGAGFLSKRSLMNKTQAFQKKSLNKTQENLKTEELKTLNYSGRSSILSIEDLLMLGKELFDEPAHSKNFSHSPNIVSCQKNHSIELKGKRTGIVKESKSRPPSKQKLTKPAKYAQFRPLRPITVVRKLKSRRRNDTPSPWSSTNY